jgi:hypothetical protein
MKRARIVADSSLPTRSPGKTVDLATRMRQHRQARDSEDRMRKVSFDLRALMRTRVAQPHC